MPLSAGSAARRGSAHGRARASLRGAQHPGQVAALLNPDVLPDELAAARSAYRAGRLEVRDRYRETRAPRELKGISAAGEEIIGYAYSPDAFVASDATGRPLRHYVELPNGARVHPDELERLQRTSSGVWRLPGGESLRLLDRSGRVLGRARSFNNAISLAAGYLRPAQLEPFTVESVDGRTRRTFSHAEASRIDRRLRDRRESLTLGEYAEQHDPGAVQRPSLPERGPHQLGLFGLSNPHGRRLHVARNPGKAKRARRRRAHEYVAELLPYERGSRAGMSPATRALRNRANRQHLSERIVERSYQRNPLGLPRRILGVDSRLAIGAGAVLAYMAATGRLRVGM